MDWRGSAERRGMDPDLFFPIGNSSSSAALVQIDEAKAAVCRLLWGTVSQQCLEWALNAGSVEGIWGRSTEAERRAMRRRKTRGCGGTERTAA
ncbi:WhiB family transcriptional regulator [Streptomyces sp. NPDC017988]|uniref:WhiB family transcriptional regulator n=1 Tax=Streptomyces sp. NPDC017988 TaxID=3365025 RepID=UPI0037A1B85D